MAPENIAARARRLFASAQEGLLATLCGQLDGHPVASASAYARGRSGEALLLISGAAEVAGSLARDSRASLTVAGDCGDARVLERVTVIGRCVPVPAAELEDAARRLYRRFPHAEAFHRAHDFEVYRLEASRVRYAAGFGETHWLEPRALCVPSPFPAVVEEGMLAPMNCDHAAVMRGFCRLFAVEPGCECPRLTAVDHEGFDLMIGGHLLRIEFERPVSSADEVRRAWAVLAMQVRETGLLAA